MPLTKQQLLIPRVLCIGGKDGEPNYPDSPFCVGDILTYLDGMYFDKDNNCGISTYDIIGFPHLFSLLQWWEKRKVNDLPQYVKDENGEVWKVTKYFIDSSVACFYTGELEKKGWLKGTETPFNLLAVEPADLTDYMEYQKQNDA
mgnify:FL=1